MQRQATNKYLPHGLFSINMDLDFQSANYIYYPGYQIDIDPVSKTVTIHDLVKKTKETVQLSESQRTYGGKPFFTASLVENGIRITPSANDNLLHFQPEHKNDVFLPQIEKNLKDNSKNLQQLANYQAEEGRIGVDLDIEGWNSETANYSYLLLFQLYLLKNFSQMSHEERNKLKDMIKTLSNLVEDAKHDEEFSKKVSHQIYEEEDKNIFFTATLEQLLNHFNEIQQKSSSILNSLKEKGRHTFNYGFDGDYTSLDAIKKYKTHQQIKDLFESGHHEIAAVSLNNGRYKVTFYNAGYGSDVASGRSHNVEADRWVRYVVCEYDINVKNETELLRFIKLLCLREVCGYGARKKLMDEIDAEIQQYIGDKPVRVIQDYGQVRGNCTTRSTEEFIKDEMPLELYEKSKKLLREIAALPSASIVTSDRQQQIPDLVNPLHATIQGLIFNRPTEIAAIIKDKAHIHGLFKYKVTGKPSGNLLHYAIVKKDEKLIEKCLFLGASATAPDVEGNTPLSLATGNPNIISMLNQYIPKSQSKEKAMVLLQAIRSGNVNSVLELVKVGLNFDPKENDGYVVQNIILDNVFFSRQGGLPKSSLITIFKALMASQAANLDLYTQDNFKQNTFTLLLSHIQGMASERKLTPDELNMLKYFSTLDTKKRYALEFSIYESADVFKSELSNISKPSMKSYERLARHLFRMRDVEKIMITLADKKHAEIMSALICQNIALNSTASFARADTIKIFKAMTIDADIRQEMEKMLISKEGYTAEELRVAPVQVAVSQKAPSQLQQKEEFVQAVQQGMEEEQMWQARKNQYYKLFDFSRGVLALITGDKSWQRYSDDPATYRPFDVVRGVASAVVGDESLRRDPGAYRFGDASRWVKSRVTGLLFPTATASSSSSAAASSSPSSAASPKNPPKNK